MAERLRPVGLRGTPAAAGLNPGPENKPERCVADRRCGRCGRYQPEIKGWSRFSDDTFRPCRCVLYWGLCDSGSSAVRSIFSVPEAGSPRAAWMSISAMDAARFRRSASRFDKPPANYWKSAECGICRNHPAAESISRHPTCRSPGETLPAARQEKSFETCLSVLWPRVVDRCPALDFH